VRGGGQPGAEILERRIRGCVHEGPERLQPRDIKLGWIASPVRWGGDVTGGVIAGEEVAHTTQTAPEARGSWPHRALVVLVGLHHPEAYIAGEGSHRRLL
jgi:hypothetical protein